MERDLDKYVGENQSEKAGKKSPPQSKKSPTLSYKSQPIAKKPASSKHSNNISIRSNEKNVITE